MPGIDELGQVGAWVASENRPEELITKVSIVDQEDNELKVLIPGREWFNVIQINAHQTMLSTKFGYCTMKRYTIKDVNGDDINDLALVLETACLEDGGPRLLFGFLKERYGGVSFRGCVAPTQSP